MPYSVSRRFEGMEITDAQQLVSYLRSRVQEIHELLTVLGRAYEACAWTGRDSEAFRQRLTEFDQRMRARTRQVEATAERLRRQVDNQVRTSA